MIYLICNSTLILGLLFSCAVFYKLNRDLLVPYLVYGTVIILLFNIFLSLLLSQGIKALL